jgi:transposase
MWAAQLRELIRNDPRQLNLHDGLWTWEVIRELLQRHFKVRVSERTMSNALKRLDITMQRPRLKAVEQNP